MSWRAFVEILRWRTTGLAEKLAEAVAGVCREPVFRLVCEKATTMTAAEARGYIAARCSARVTSQTRLLLREQGLQLHWQRELSRSAKSRLVTMVLHDVQRASRRQPALRRAA